MAKRIRDAGMNLLLDFHYSDYWADPQQQYKPLGWRSGMFERSGSVVLRKGTIQPKHPDCFTCRG